VSFEYSLCLPHADGHQVSYKLYMGLNARGQFGKCVFGGSFAVK